MRDFIEAQSMSRVNPPYKRRRALQYVLRWRTRQIDRSKGTCQPSIHHTSRSIQPNHGDGKEDEEHMNGSISAALSPTDEQQPLIVVQMSPEHKPAKAAEGAGAVTHTA